MTKIEVLLLLTGIAMLIDTGGCCRKQVRLATPSNVTNDNSYMDLEPGSKLRIVVPLLKSGEFRPMLIQQEIDGKTISISSTDLIGYTISYFDVVGKKGGRVQLKFSSAEETRQGQTVPKVNPPSLPFELPQKAGHLRLIYLVRVSQADHNMAIIGSKRLDTLNAFTDRLKQNPGICNIHADVFCSWVPAGIAVRPEK